MAAQILEHKTLPQQTAGIIRDPPQLMFHSLFALALGCRGYQVGLATGGGARLLATKQVLLAWLGPRLMGLSGLRGLLALLFARSGGCRFLSRAFWLRLGGFLRLCLCRGTLLGIFAILGLGLGGPTRLRFLLASFTRLLGTCLRGVGLGFGLPLA